MTRYINTIREVSHSNNSFETEIAKLLRRASIQNQTNDVILDTLISTTQPADYNFSAILTDRGDGRISAGLKSLELLAIIRSGVNQASLFMFDNVIYVGNYSSFNTSDEKALTNIVIANLGMDIVISSLDDDKTATLRNTCLKIAKLVKSGDYTKDKYSDTVRAECKRLVRLYIREYRDNL